MAGFLYLAVVVDVWSRRVVGWAMANHLRAALVLEALNMALGQRRPREVMVWTTAATGIECHRVGRSCDATFREPSRWRLLS